MLEEMSQSIANSLFTEVCHRPTGCVDEDQQEVVLITPLGAVANSIGIVGRWYVPPKEYDKERGLRVEFLRAWADRIEGKEKLDNRSTGDETRALISRTECVCGAVLHVFEGQEGCEEMRTMSPLWSLKPGGLGHGMDDLTPRDWGWHKEGDYGWFHQCDGYTNRICSAKKKELGLDNPGDGG